MRPLLLMLTLLLTFATSTTFAEPVPDDLTEGNSARWGTFAGDGACSAVGDDPARVRAGSLALRFDTMSGFDTGVRYPRDGAANWDLRDREALTFWAYAENLNQHGFQGPQPVIVLRGSGGSVTLTPQSNLMVINAWRQFTVPLAGGSGWTRTTTGTLNFADVWRLEIHQDTWTSSFRVFYDGVTFTRKGPVPSPPGSVRQKLLVFIIDPVMQTRGGRRLSQVYGFFEPVRHSQQLVEKIRQHGQGIVALDLVGTQLLGTYPPMTDGFAYTDASFDQAWTSKRFPSARFDYARFVAEQGLAGRVERGEVDEVWIDAFPGAGLYESTMAGDGAYWVNSPPVLGVPSRRAFVLMGFSYERPAGTAGHAYGHRAESIMAKIYGGWSPSNNWGKFARLDRDAPGQGGVGNIHFPVNAVQDYDYANPRAVASNADDWANYPNFRGLTRVVSSAEWLRPGVDAEEAYFDWWYSRLPRFEGWGPDGKLANWHRYIVEVDRWKNGDPG